MDPDPEIHGIDPENLDSRNLEKTKDNLSRTAHSKTYDKISEASDGNHVSELDKIQTEDFEEDVTEWVDDGNDEEDDRISLGLVGKLWSERTLNPSVFMSTIKNVWVTTHGVDINMIGKNLFQFQFYHWRDKEKVLAGQPWHFDKVALLLTEMDAASKPSELIFYSLPIWVRIYDIPFRGRTNETNARMLGDKIGGFLEMDKSENLGMEKSLRLRVMLDVRKPLKKYVPIKVRGGEVCKCPVKYEKLPLICYYCGKLGHGSSECKEVFGENSPVKNYGIWLKASPWRPMRNGDEMEMGDKSNSCRKKLFFPKKLPTKETLANPNEAINSVASMLGKVALNLEGMRAVQEDEITVGMGTISEAVRNEDKEENLVNNHEVNKGDSDTGEAQADLRNIETCSTVVNNNYQQSPSTVVNNDYQQNPPTVVNNDYQQNLSKESSHFPAQLGNMSKRGQKWKKLARAHSSVCEYDYATPPVGEKRTIETRYVDEHMFDDEARGIFKKRIVPMEVDNTHTADNDNVAGPKSWALQSQ